MAAFIVRSGPAKIDLMIAYFRGRSGDEAKFVTSLGSRGHLEVITNISRAWPLDEDKTRWMLEGQMMPAYQHASYVARGGVQPDWTHFRMTYSLTAPSTMKGRGETLTPDGHPL